VEAVGANVERFKPGDDFFGSTTHGCFAEYACVGEDQLQLRPAKMTFEQLAAVPAAAVTALHGLRDHGKLQSGQRVLINGASGGVGTFAVQLAKAFGTQVTGVCSTRNLDMVRSIGADHVIDYTQQDFTRAEQRYDLIFGFVAKRSFSECKLALSDTGTYVTTEFSPAIALYGQWISMTGSKKMVPLTPRLPSKNDLAFLKKQLDEGKLMPVIDRCYSLNEVPAALNYLADGHARGKIVIKHS